MQKNMKVIFKNKIDTSIFDKGFYLGILEEIRNLKKQK